MRYIILLIMFWVLGCQAQILLHKNLTSRDGLAQSHIFSLLNDEQGYLWVGTYDGVSRWDGNEFKNFNIINGLTSSLVISLFQTRDGRLFIGSDDGASVSNGHSFRAYGLRDCFINSICEDEQGNLFFATRNQGLWIHSGSDTVHFDKTRGLKSNCVNSLVYVPGWGVVAGTDSGAWVIGSSLTLERKLNNADVTSMDYRAGTLSMGTNDQGLLRYEDESWQRMCDEPRLQKIRDVSIDDRGEFYIATMSGGVMHYDGQWRSLNTHNGLAHDAVFALLAGKDGNMFFGTAGGLSIFQPARMESFCKNSGLEKDYILSLYQRKNKDIVFGTFGGGLYTFQNSHCRPYLPNIGLESQSIFHIYEWQETLWLCTLRGLYRLVNGRAELLISINPSADPGITCLAGIGSDSLLIGTEKGFLIYSAGQISPLDPQHQMAVNTLEKGRDGTIYAGLEKGVLCYRKDKGVEFLQDSLLNQSNVQAIHQHSSGPVFFGTDRGLCVWNGHALEWIQHDDGLVHTFINGICEDAKGRLYLTSYHGVQILISWGIPVRPRVLDVYDGLPSNEVNANAILCDAGGDIWIGTINGLSRYRPVRDRFVRSAPKAIIQSVSVFDKEVDTRELESADFSLEYRNNYMRITYLGLCLGCPESIQYRVRLFGSDKGWYETGENHITYANLLDGVYTFKVQARSEWSDWSEPVTLSFWVVPPFWKTWWFLVVLVFGTVTIIGVPIYLRMRSLLVVERLRGKIAADLHDNIGAGLTEISILSEVTGKLYPQDSHRAQEHLKRISDSARHLIDTMSDTVWLVSPKRDTLYDLMLRLRDYYADILSASGIILKLENLELLKNMHLPMEHRQQLYLLFKEAIHNSLKHSHCRTITLKALVKRKRLVMILDDDGTGFDSFIRDPQGNGLTNMEKRAESIGGSLSVTSQAEKGTRIEFVGGS
ncbi:hypothetical protein GF406_05790 [candidate division KSB1 bacterium]|nr:hypothetical protein [candidate division KSB1 bacterium]